MRQFLILCFFLSSQLLFAQSQRGFFTQVGDPSPEFSITTLDGKTVKPADYKGKILLICMFGTRCPPCLRELPEVDKQIREQFSKENVEILAVSIVDTDEKIQKFKDSRKYDFTFASDPGWKNFKMFAESSLPRSIVIDEKGTIIYQTYGYDPAEFANMVQLIKQSVDNLK